MSSFTTPLVVSPLTDGRRWRLVFPFGYDVGYEGSGDRITVPLGFVTDFASTPFPIWGIIPPWGKYGKAAVVHDYLYMVKARTRKQSDDIFREGMVVLKVDPVRVFLMYWAVRLFGWLAWLRE
ncbi:MAG: DUF1353 domain-containing protein [Dehalococcoidales bacterium]|nr:DUF1353 domain-containing protein [Dehalococcoidales bacterium]